MLHQLGYESLNPRPQHRNADESGQQAFKKSSPKQSKP
ncbi:winged helix-turn-helix domain-containing protein [Gimesia benthica]|uniref:Winged helix-turn-helix domain-containing protein n=1 Tax=Gimesia benthica TaxID=2608982 RepID=A0A6I6ADW8_9PLAN|nr:winged helix-turn-helix domain-containing protein [Gimesia benthica]